MPDTRALHPYLKVLEPFSDQELRQITQVKRFFEWVQGDAEFRRSLDSGDLAPAYRDRLPRIGVMFDLAEVALLWEQPAIACHFLTSQSLGKSPDLPDELVTALEPYPLLTLWGRFCAQKSQIQREIRKRIFRVPRNPAFDAWRLRRIAAVRSELGFFGHAIDHPILAFELGDGCSVGCWFCAFAARKLTTNFSYPDHRDCFRQIAQACVDIFGQAQASMALLYYGTEPHDNPHYLDFLRDYADITGYPVCTSTAVVDDAAWIRELIAFYRRGTHPWPRLSVLSTAKLLKIHDLYTPDELRDVELLMQMKDHPRPKVSGGRILQEQSGLRDRDTDRYLDGIVPQGSIACVSGFLINLVNGTIEMISPCYTSEQWPHGYRVFDRAAFEPNPADFRRALEGLIARNMPATPDPEMIARFRDDLTYRPTAEGFDLVSPNQVHHFRGPVLYGVVGEMIAAGRYSYARLSDALMTTPDVNPLIAANAVQKLFEGGFLDEVNPTAPSSDWDSKGPGL
jgi:radical SAM family RiPP maturation amino acid epimerase